VVPIDPTFREKREIVDQIEGIDVWGPVDPPESLGIAGTDVAVDWDICEGNGVCIEVCPVQLYDWRDTPGHPGSSRKAFPAREPDCIKCMACETQCPVEAISISY
jgi:NAD-dependent dihydropyrimidine dehydrogenase PreA subunit